MPDFTVVDDRGNVVLETDDWVAAVEAGLTTNWPRGGRRFVRGTHPTHHWGPPYPGQDPPDARRCTACGAWDNGSYGSQGPCGYNWDVSLVGAVLREKAARAAAAGA